MNLLEKIRSGPELLTGNRRIFVLCLLLFLISGMISFWIFFPADVLQRALVRELARQTGLKMEGSKSEMLFPFGLKLDLKVYPDHAGLVPLHFTDLQLTPAWTRLLAGTAAVDLQGKLAGGTVEARAARNGRLQLELAEVEVGDLQQKNLPYLVQGKLTGALTLERRPELLDSQGEFRLQLRESYLSDAGRGLLPERLLLGRLQLAGKFNQRRLSIEKALLTEGSIEMSGGGTMLVAETPDQTRVNLNIRLHPNQSSPDSLVDMLKLTGVKPTVDGSYLLRIAGTLARPVLR